MKNCTGSNCCNSMNCAEVCKRFRQSHRQSHASLFLVIGLVGGFLGALALARRKTAPPKPEGLDTWKSELAKERGEVEAGLLAARIQAEYAKLYESRPRFDHPVLVDHLEDNILPGLALYSVLMAVHPEREAALAAFDRMQDALVVDSRMDRMSRVLKFVPKPFSVFRKIHNAMLPRMYPREGWDFQWVEDSDKAVAYNCRDCFYLRVLTAYGVPELTAHFCRIDDVMFGRFPNVAFKRTKTLGRGDDCCDFRFESKN